MGKIGSSYPGAGGKIQQPSSSALAQFDAARSPIEEKAMRREFLAAVLGLIGVVALIGWALTL